MSSFLLPGSAIPAHVLSGDSFSAGSNFNVAGTMPNNGALVLTPGASAQVIPAGYHSGSGNVPAVVVPVANVLTGTTIAGQTGTIPNNSGLEVAARASDPSGAKLRLFLPSTSAYYNSFASVSLADANFIAANIPNGMSMFGLVGTNTNKRYATGTASTVYQIDASGGYVQSISVSGLAFTPRVVIATNGSGMTGFISTLSYYNYGYVDAYNAGGNKMSGGPGLGTAAYQSNITSGAFVATVYWQSASGGGTSITWYAWE
jgi:hypothetical protein